MFKLNKYSVQASYEWLKQIFLLLGSERAPQIHLVSLLEIQLNHKLFNSWLYISP